MKTSIENRVKEAQRVIQRELMSENCSVNMKPTSFNDMAISDKFVPVVDVSIPDVDTLPRISRKIRSAIDEFNLCGVLSKSSDGSVVYSVYARKIGVDDAPSLTFKDFVDELKQMWKNRSISL